MCNLAWFLLPISLGALFYAVWAHRRITRLEEDTLVATQEMIGDWFLAALKAGCQGEDK
jgi:hypothetical protein